MAFKKGDIVRHKFRAMKGLYEISATFNHHIYQYLITNNECESETHVKESELIFVCSVKDRKDSQIK